MKGDRDGKSAKRGATSWPRELCVLLSAKTERSSSALRFGIGEKKW